MHETIGAPPGGLKKPLSNISNRMKSTFVNNSTTSAENKARSKFLSWTRVQLIDLLISEAHELRYESSMSYSHLRESAEELFMGRPVPEKPLPLSRNEIRKRKENALLIQNFWIKRKYRPSDISKLNLVGRMPSGIFALGNAKSQHDLSEIIAIAEDEIDYASETFIGHYNGLYDDIVDDTPHGRPLSRNNRIKSIMKTTEPTRGNLQRESSNRSVTEYLERADSMTEHNMSLALTVGFETESINTAASSFERGIGFPSNSGVNAPLTRARSNALIEAKKTLHFLDEPWKSPDWEASLRYADFVQPRHQGGCEEGSPYSFWKTTTGRHCCLGLLGEQCDYFKEGQMSEFGLYGPGVTNYFKFLKWCIWLFFILSLIAAVQIVINSNGNGYLYDRGLAHLAITTVGNLDFTARNSTFIISITVCKRFAYVPQTCEQTKSQLSMLYSVIDIILSSLILLAYLWLRQFQFEEENELDKNTIYASQYTVMVENLPSNVTEKEVHRHFHALLNEDITSNAPHESSPIVVIQLSSADELAINECSSRGELINVKKRLLNQHRYHCTVTRSFYVDNKYLAEEEIRLARFQFSKVCKELDAKIKAKSESIRKLNATLTPSQNNETTTAFLTFDHETAANLIIKQFKNTSFSTYYFSDIHPFRFHNHLLKVSQAPEPSTIIWENLKYSSWNKILRRSVAIIVAMMFICISIIITLGTKSLHVQFASSSGTNSFCTSAFQHMSRSEQRDMVAVDRTSYTNCYCQQSSELFTTADPYCKQYVKNRLNQQFFMFFASITVLLINSTLDYILKLFSTFEKHSTQNTKERCSLIRVFILKYINTACVFLINTNSTLLDNIFKVNPNSSLEFSTDWYSSVGVLVLLVQFGDIFVCHGFKTLQYYMHKRKLRIAHKNIEKNFHRSKNLVFTQEELNEMQQGPRFELAYRYGQLLSTIFACLTFSSGMPVLYIVVFFNFLLFYFVEKFMFVNLYRIPPRFNTYMNKTVAYLIPVAVFIHLLMAIWVLSNNQFFSNSSSTDSSSSLSSTTNDAIDSQSLSDRISQNHTFSLFIFAVILGALITLYILFRTFFNSLFTVIKGLCIKSNYKDEEDSEHDNQVQLVTFRNAMKRNLIKGLATYNILQNPDYKQIFGITWKTAVEHRYIKSLALAKEVSDDFDDDFDQAQNLFQNKIVNNAYTIPPSPYSVPVVPTVPPVLHSKVVTKSPQCKFFPDSPRHDYDDTSDEIVSPDAVFIPNMSFDFSEVNMSNLYTAAVDEDITSTNDFIQRDHNKGSRITHAIAVQDKPSSSKKSPIKTSILNPNSNPKESSNLPKTSNIITSPPAKPEPQPQPQLDALSNNSSAKNSRKSLTLIIESSSAPYVEEDNDDYTSYFNEPPPPYIPPKHFSERITKTLNSISLDRIEGSNDNKDEGLNIHSSHASFFVPKSSHIARDDLADTSYPSSGEDSDYLPVRITTNKPDKESFCLITRALKKSIKNRDEDYIRRQGLLLKASDDDDEDDATMFSDELN